MRSRSMQRSFNLLALRWIEVSADALHELSLNLGDERGQAAAA
jgi:hypothetical protein